MQEIVGGAQSGTLQLSGPTRADTLHEPQLTLQRSLSVVRVASVLTCGGGIVR